MKCPKCSGSLNPTELKGVKIDECDKCDGKWFDRDELRKAKDRTDDDVRWIDFDVFDDNSEKYEASSSEKKCPKDSSEMTSLTYMDSRVVIDKCNTCKGVWLDKNEFEKIIKYLEHVVISTTASEYGKETIKEFSEIFTGPENVISEIKDFISIVNFYTTRLAIENPWTMKLAENIDRTTTKIT